VRPPIIQPLPCVRAHGRSCLAWSPLGPTWSPQPPAGVGNWVADEVLYQVRCRPRPPSLCVRAGLWCGAAGGDLLTQAGLDSKLASDCGLAVVVLHAPGRLQPPETRHMHTCAHAHTHTHTHTRDCTRAYTFTGTHTQAPTHAQAPHAHATCAACTCTRAPAPTHTQARIHPEQPVADMGPPLSAALHKAMKEVGEVGVSACARLGVCVCVCVCACMCVCTQGEEGGRGGGCRALLLLPLPLPTSRMQGQH